MSSTILLIYTQRTTSRLRYTVQTLIGDMLGLEHRITTDADEFRAYDGPRLSYAAQPLTDELHLTCSRLLFETGIDEQTLNLGRHVSTVTLFHRGAINSMLPFDPLAASFFMLSRYEEYLPHRLDLYGRFEAENSVAFQHGFIEDPVVDRWAILLGRCITDRYPTLVAKPRKFRHINTIDIDNAYAYRLKGAARTLGAMGRDVVNGDLDTLRHRLSVLMGKGHDPYDTYDYLLSIAEEFNTPTTFFFLLGDYGTNDKNVAHNNPEFQALIKDLADHVQVGIHPSFGSNSEPRRLGIEKNRLENIVHREVMHSRQHFLVLHMPHTYRRLVSANIAHDHSMGYASCIGFRAGTCTPYRHYDLDQEMPLPLTVHPFAVMDATLKYYMKLSPTEAMQRITNLVRTIREVNGTFVSLWHNETVSDQGIWADWRQVYRHVFEEVR